MHGVCGMRTCVCTFVCVSECVCVCVCVRAYKVGLRDWQGQGAQVAELPKNVPLLQKGTRACSL